MIVDYFKDATCNQLESDPSAVFVVGKSDFFGGEALSTLIDFKTGASFSRQDITEQHFIISILDGVGGQYHCPFTDIEKANALESSLNAAQNAAAKPQHLRA